MKLVYVCLFDYSALTTESAACSRNSSLYNKAIKNEKKNKKLSIPNVDYVFIYFGSFIPES